MFKALIDLLRLPQLLQLDDRPYRILVAMAIEAAEGDGYIKTPYPKTLGYVGPEVADEDAHGWYFPSLRRKAREKFRRKRDNNRRRKDKATSNDGAVEDCTQSSSLILTPNISSQLRPAGACARNSTILSKSEPGISEAGRDTPLFPGMSDDDVIPEPLPIRKAQPHDALFDAVAAVTGADNQGSTRKMVAKVARSLLGCNPPYTPEDVHKLPEVLRQQPWWQRGMTISPQIVQKHIGLVRALPQTTKEDTMDCEFKSLEQLRREALRSRR